MTPLTGDENSISSSRLWVSQVPLLIFARALSPYTPEGSSAHLPLASPTMLGFSRFGGLAAFNV
jgi:hypothetical protein